MKGFPLFHRSMHDSLAKRSIIFMVIGLLSWSFCPIVFAQITYPYANKDFELHYKNLQKNFTQLLSGVTLRNVVDRIAVSANVPIWIDRRVDAEMIVSMQATNESYQAAIDRLLTDNNLDMTWIGSVPCICNSNDTDRINYAYWQIAICRRGELVAKASDPWKWTGPAEPKQLVKEFTRLAKLNVQGIEAVEHDLWNAKQLPKLDVATVMTLLLAGHDLTLISNNDGTIRIEAIPESIPSVVFAYEPSFLEAINKDAYTTWTAQWTDEAEWRKQANRNWLRASVAAHRSLYTTSIDPLNVVESTAAPEAANQADMQRLKKLQRKRFTTRLRGQLVKILPAVLSQVELNWDSNQLSEDQGNQVIDVEAKEMDIDQLLAAIGEAAGLIIRRDQLTVTIEAQP
jgi:hypothetical protein